MPLKKIDDPKLRSRLVRELLKLVSLERCWGRVGPSRRLVRYIRSGRGTMRFLTRREDTVLRVALDLWDGSGHARFADVLALPELELACVGFLLFASGESFEEWVVEVRDHLVARKMARPATAAPTGMQRIPAPAPREVRARRKR